MTTSSVEGGFRDIAGLAGQDHIRIVEIDGKRFARISRPAQADILEEATPATPPESIVVRPTAARVLETAVQSVAPLSFSYIRGSDGISTFHAEGDLSGEGISTILNQLAGAGVGDNSQSDSNLNRQILMARPTEVVSNQVEVAEPTEKVVLSEDQSRKIAESGLQRVERYIRMRKTIACLSFAAVSAVSFPLMGGDDGLTDHTPAGIISSVKADLHQLTDQPAATFRAQFGRIHIW